MHFRELWEREKYIIVHGQSGRFRITKWVIIVAICALVYVRQGLQVMVAVFFLACFIGAVLHFFLRYMTDGWEKSWGPFKKIL